MKQLLSAFILGIIILYPSFIGATSGVYGGGPIYQHRDYAINELKSSGFTNLVIWTIHIEADGSLGFNGEFPLVKNGVYIGDQTYPEFRNDVASLKTGDTSITRVEFGLSGYGSGTYDNVRDLLACQEAHCGTGPDSILYRNFQALKNAFPSIDALDNDDEGTYDLNSSVPFHIMLADIGFKTAIVPYTNRSFWQAFVDQVNEARPGSVDLTYLQVYAGGAGNNPCYWDLGLPIIAGLWSRDDSPAQVQSRMQNWKNNCGIEGGFMWLYDDFDNSSQVTQYASAINNVFDNEPAPDDGVATVFQHCHYDGYRVELSPGEYTANQLKALGANNDDISSLQVSNGYQITVFQNDNFSGFSWTLTENDSCITDNQEGRSDNQSWNDDISSIVVEPADSPTDGELQNGRMVNNLSGASGSEQLFYIDVPVLASNLSVTQSGGNGDADLYVRFSQIPSTSNYDCRPYLNGNNESCSFASPQVGRYYILVRGYSAFDTVSLVARFDEPGSDDTYNNATNVEIPDNQSTGVYSAVQSTTSGSVETVSVSLTIVHTYIGDLVVDLVHPDGTTFNLHNRSGGSSDNLVQTYSVNVGGKSAGGEWRLRVKDLAAQDTGYIDDWSLTINQ